MVITLRLKLKDIVTEVIEEKERFASAEACSRLRAD